MKIKLNGIEIDVIEIQMTTDFIDPMGCGTITHEVSRFYIEFFKHDAHIFKALCCEKSFEVVVNEKTFLCSSGFGNGNEFITIVQ